MKGPKGPQPTKAESMPKEGKIKYLLISEGYFNKTVVLTHLVGNFWHLRQKIVIIDKSGDYFTYAGL
jgi:hypothetical protein